MQHAKGGSKQTVITIERLKLASGTSKQAAAASRRRQQASGGSKQVEKQAYGGSNQLVAAIKR